MLLLRKPWLLMLQLLPLFANGGKMGQRERIKKIFQSNFDASLFQRAKEYNAILTTELTHFGGDHNPVAYREDAFKLRTKLWDFLSQMLETFENIGGQDEQKLKDQGWSGNALVDKIGNLMKAARKSLTEQLKLSPEFKNLKFKFTVDGKNLQEEPVYSLEKEVILVKRAVYTRQYFTNPTNSAFLAIPQKVVNCLSWLDQMDMDIKKKKANNLDKLNMWMRQFRVFIWLHAALKVDGQLLQIGEALDKKFSLLELLDICQQNETNLPDPHRVAGMFCETMEKVLPKYKQIHVYHSGKHLTQEEVEEVVRMQALLKVALDTFKNDMEKKFTSLVKTPSVAKSLDKMSEYENIKDAVRKNKRMPDWMPQAVFNCLFTIGQQNAQKTGKETFVEAMDWVSEQLKFYIWANAAMEVMHPMLSKIAQKF